MIVLPPFIEFFLAFYSILFAIECNDFIHSIFPFFSRQQQQQQQQQRTFTSTLTLKNQSKKWAEIWKQINSICPSVRISVQALNQIINTHFNHNRGARERRRQCFDLIQSANSQYFTFFVFSFVFYLLFGFFVGGLLKHAHTHTHTQTHLSNKI